MSDAVAASTLNLSHQLGFGDYYLKADLVISQSNGVYNQAKLWLENSSGKFQTNIFLNPNNTSMKDQKESAAQQIVTINSITMSMPTANQDGTIYIDCSFTDLSGKTPDKTFNGEIAKWKADGPA